MTTDGRGGSANPALPSAAGRPRGRKRRAVALLLLVSLIAMGGALRPGHAANAPSPDVSPDPRWTQFTQQKDGLVSNSVWSILAAKGGLWLGGESGVTYFDGAWTDYSAAPETVPGAAVFVTTTQPIGAVYALLRDPADGAIWAGAEYGLVARWDGTQWRAVLEFPSKIFALASFAGELWVATAEGLYRYDGSRTLLVDAVGRQPVFSLALGEDTLWLGAQAGLWRYRSGRWAQIGSGESRFAGGVYALLVDRSGGLVAGTPSGVGWRPHEGAPWQWHETLDELGAPVLVQALVEDHAGAIWAGTDGAGVFVLELQAKKVNHLGYTGDPDLTARFVRALAVDQDGSIWFATPAGAFRYQARMWVYNLQGERPDDPRNYINDLLMDHDGVLWAATGGGGVRRIVGPQGPETNYTAEDGAADTVLVLAEDRQGAIWAGGFDGLQRFADEVWSRPVVTASLPSPTVTALLADGGTLWIGTETGLVRYQVATGDLEEEPALAGESVEALALDSLERLWVGTWDDGLWLRQETGEWRHFVNSPGDPNSLPGDSIVGSGLAADPTVPGGMWAIVQHKGLVHWDGDQWSDAGFASQLPSNLLWTLYTDPSDGALWIGSEAGVTRYDGLTWTTCTTQDGLLSAVIYAVVRSRDGGYWFGGRTGLTHFVPDHTPPWVKITQLAGPVQRGPGGQTEITVGGDLIVNYQAGDLQTAGSKLKTLYRLRGPGLDQGWQEVTQPFVPIHFVRPGAYTLELWARDQSANYSDVTALQVTALAAPVEVPVPVLGPVERSVFRILVTLGAIALLGAGYVTLEVINNRRRSREAVERAYNPYISGEPVRRDDMFFGRRDLVQRIVDTLHNNSIMIYGERRIGKTTLLFQLVTVLREVNDPDYWFVPIFVDLEGTPQEEFFHYLLEEILAGVETLANAEEEILPQLGSLRLFTQPATAYSDRDFNRDLNRITEVLEAYGARHDPAKHLRLILLMDEMDVMSKYDSLVQQQLRRIFMREFAATLGAVVAGIQISKDWDRVESPWYNLFNEIALAPFTREQAYELLIEPVRGYYQYEPAAVEFILDHAEGRPYKVQQYGLEAVNHMLSHRRRRITLEDVEVAHRRIQAAEEELRARPAPRRRQRLIPSMPFPLRAQPERAAEPPGPATGEGEQCPADPRPDAEPTSEAGS